MRIYTVHAEARRPHWGAVWRVVGVWIGGQSFWPAYPGARAATIRERQAGNAALLDLPVTLAPSEAQAARVGILAAREGGGWTEGTYEDAPDA